MRDQNSFLDFCTAFARSSRSASTCPPPPPACRVHTCFSVSAISQLKSGRKKAFQCISTGDTRVWMVSMVMHTVAATIAPVYVSESPVKSPRSPACNKKKINEIKVTDPLHLPSSRCKKQHSLHHTGDTGYISPDH